MMQKYGGRTGWFGNSQGHAMAARGIRLYARKDQVLMDPLFYAQKREREVPFVSILEKVKQGDSYNDLCRKYPDADRDDIRRQGIRAVEMKDGGGTLSMLDRNGVDQSVKLAESNPQLKRRMLDVLQDSQKSSFIADVKVEALKGRLAA